MERWAYIGSTGCGRYGSMARVAPQRMTSRRRTVGIAVGAALLVLLLSYCGLLLLGWLGNDGLEDVSQAEDEAAAARTAQASPRW